MRAPNVVGGRDLPKGGHPKTKDLQARLRQQIREEVQPWKADHVRLEQQLEADHERLEQQWFADKARLESQNEECQRSMQVQYDQCVAEMQQYKDQMALIQSRVEGEKKGQIELEEYRTRMEAQL